MFYSTFLIGYYTLVCTVHCTVLRYSNAVVLLPCLREESYVLSVRIQSRSWPFQNSATVHSTIVCVSVCVIGELTVVPAFGNRENRRKVLIILYHICAAQYSTVGYGWSLCTASASFAVANLTCDRIQR